MLLPTLFESVLPWIAKTALITTPTLLAEDPEIGKCSGSILLGVIKIDGDSDTTGVNGTADAIYRREHDRFTGGFWLNLQEDKSRHAAGNSSVSQRRVGGKLKYDYFVSKRTYVWGQGSVETDKAADLDTRTTISAGLGHQFFENEAWIGPGTWSLQGEAGLAWIDDKFVQATSQDDSYMSARLAYGAEYKPNDKWVFTQTAELFPSIEESDDMLAKLDTRAKVSLTEKMLAQLRWYWVWDNTPAAGTSRTNDTYELSIGWSF